MIRNHLLVVLLSVIALSLACDVGTSDSSSSDDVEGDGGGGGGGDGDPSGDGGVVLSGGCDAIGVGPLAGTVVKSVPRKSPGIPWQDVDGARDADGAFAKVALAAGQESEELQITGFAFQLPSKNVFQGVEVELSRQAPDGGIVDGGIRLIGVANQSGWPKYIASPWPQSIVGVHHYGQATDTWRMDLKAPDVETAEFGVALWVKRSDGPASATALVDAIRIRVFYCP